MRCHRCTRRWRHLLAFCLGCVFVVTLYPSVRTNCQQETRQRNISESAGGKADVADESLKFAWQLARIRQEANSSLYKFDRPGTLLPVMRLRDAERSRHFRELAALTWTRRQHLVVATTARNAAAGFRSTLRNLRRLGRVFNRTTLIVVENDSSDGTRRLLISRRRKIGHLVLLGCVPIGGPDCRLDIRYASGVKHQPGSSMSRSFSEQVDRGLVMSALRNMYLSYAYKHFATSSQLLLVLDPDVTWADWDLGAILQALYYFKDKPQLEQLCSLTIDIPTGMLFDPCTLTFFLNKHFGEDTRYPVVDFDTSVARASPNLPPVKVDSCFQGFAFYRLDKLAQRNLRYTRSQGEWMCEHNTLSRQLTEVYIDPQLRLMVKAANIG